jgi:hypothetical protein
MGRGADRDGDDRGVVRRGVGADDASAAWPEQARDQLSARDRLAGAQAWSVRPLRLSGRLVPERDLSAGLRRAANAGAGQGGSGLCADFAGGGSGGRVACGGGVAEVAGAAAGVERVGSASAVGHGDAVVGGGPGDGAGGGPAVVRCPVGRGNGRGVRVGSRSGPEQGGK